MEPVGFGIRMPISSKNNLGWVWNLSGYHSPYFSTFIFWYRMQKMKRTIDHKFVDGAESLCSSSSSSLFIFPFIINFRVLSPFWCPPGIEVNWQKLQRNYLDYDNNVLVLYCYTLSSVYIFKRRNFDVWRWHKSFCMNIE